MVFGSSWLMPAPAMPYFSVPFDDVQPVAPAAVGAVRADVATAAPPTTTATARAAVAARSFLVRDISTLLVGAGWAAVTCRRPPAAGRRHGSVGGRVGRRRPVRT